MEPPRGSRAAPASAAPVPGRPSGKVSCSPPRWAAPNQIPPGQNPVPIRAPGTVEVTGGSGRWAQPRAPVTAAQKAAPPPTAAPCPQPGGPAGARCGVSRPAAALTALRPRSALASGPRTARLRLWEGAAGTAGLPGGRFAGCALQEGVESSYFLPKCQLPARDSLPPTAGSHLCHGCLRGRHSLPLGPSHLPGARAGTASVLSRSVALSPRSWLRARDGTPMDPCGSSEWGETGHTHLHPPASLTVPSTGRWSRAYSRTLGWLVSSPQPNSEGL